MIPLKIQVYADGANKIDMLRNYHEGFVKGFTTNPTLMKNAGVTDYESFASSVLEVITDLPISFEVFSDDFTDMYRQALKINSWGKNVNVKIPITNTNGISSLKLVKNLLKEGVKLNVTAIMTERQVLELRDSVESKDNVIVSIFAGRIGDCGVDPMPLMKKAVQTFHDLSETKILWASPRGVLNVYQAEECGCQIITATDDILKKIPFRGKDLAEFSLETVKMFHNDAQQAGFTL